MGDYITVKDTMSSAIAGLAAQAALSSAAMAADTDGELTYAIAIGFQEDRDRKALEQDWLAIAQGVALEEQRLWLELSQAEEQSWQSFSNALKADARGWDFWIDWYDKCFYGKPQDWGGLLTDIAIIPFEEWEKGPYHIAQLIQELERQSDAAMAVPNPKTVEAVQGAATINRAPLRVVLDALIQNLSRELERLRGDNALDPDVRDLLDELRRIVSRLQELLPDVGPVDQESAGEMASLLGLYKVKLGNWPRHHADEVVDGFFRIALIGLSAGTFGLFGLPAWAGTAIGGAVFGGRRLVEAAKNLKGPFSGGGT